MKWAYRFFSAGLIGLGCAVQNLPAQTAPVANPVVTLPKKYRDQPNRSILPALPSKNKLVYAPIGLRFGTGEMDVAYFIFDQKKKGGTGPDTLYLWIPEHPMFNEPKPFRGRPTKDPQKIQFSDVIFSAERDGVKRQFNAQLFRHPHVEGPITIDMNVQTEYEGKKTVMQLGLPESASLFGNAKSMIRVFTLFDPVALQLRSIGDGTEISGNLNLGEWHILPLEGMDPSIRATLVDSNGTSVQKHVIVNTLSKYLEPYSWKFKLRPLMKGERYRLQTIIHLGPWYGDVKQEITTMSIDRQL